MNAEMRVITEPSGNGSNLIRLPRKTSKARFKQFVP